jgi:hypothetical protein
MLIATRPNCDEGFSQAVSSTDSGAILHMRKLFFTFLGVAGLLTACPSQPPEPSLLEPQILQIRFNQIENSSFRASVVNNLKTTALISNADFTLQAVSQSTFTVGSRASGTGFRYLRATFKVTPNASVSLRHLSFVAVNLALTNLDGTAISQLKRYDGTDANLSLARAILPTQATGFDGFKPQISQDNADFQVFPSSELPVASGGLTYLDYGFVAKTESKSRLLSSGNPGYVTFAVKIPLQAQSKDDPFAFTLTFATFTDDTARVTETLEEQNLAPSLLAARASDAVASSVNVFPSSTFSSVGLITRKICSVRTAIGFGKDPGVFLFPIPTDLTGCV